MSKPKKIIGLKYKDRAKLADKFILSQQLQAGRVSEIFILEEVEYEDHSETIIKIVYHPAKIGK